MRNEKDYFYCYNVFERIRDFIWVFQKTVGELLISEVLNIIGMFIRDRLLKVFIAN